MKIATIKNVQNLFSDPICISTAARKINVCKKKLGKDYKDSILTIEEFCQFYSLPYKN